MFIVGKMKLLKRHHETDMRSTDMGTQQIWGDATDIRVQQTWGDGHLPLGVGSAVGMGMERTHVSCDTLSIIDSNFLKVTV